RGRIAVTGQEESGRCRRLPRPPPRDRGGRSLAPTPGPGRGRAPAPFEGGKKGSHLGRLLGAPALGGMDFRRRPARASGGKPGLLHVVPLILRSPLRVTTSPPPSI